MATKKKLLQAAAGQAGGAGLNVEEVFSTYLYTGAQGVDNGIDLHNEGGLVWIKSRATANHALFDTERGIRNVLVSNSSSAQYYDTNTLTAFSHDGAGGTGFFASADAMTGASGVDYASWTFRKAPKFFTCLTYTGDGVAGRSISHDLGSTPAFIVVKRTDSTGSWYCWHTSLNTSYGLLESTSAFQTGGAQYVFGNSTSVVQPTSSAFTVGTSVNASSATYVAYLFAHNDGDGDFGPDADADIIKCGSYTGNGSTTLREIDLGFEPQWVVVKRTDSTSDWAIMDNMRGALYPKVGQTAPSILEANTSDTDTTTIRRDWGITANGIGITDNHASINASGGTYIYIAIRRGPMAVPTSATDVFDMSYATDANDAPFPVDMFLNKIYGGGNTYARDRIRGGTKYLLTETTNAEITGTDVEFDDMTGTGLTGWGTSFIFYNWKRAPNYFDVVAYTGNGTAGHTISHNLGVAPEMIWVKERDNSTNWNVYHKGLNGGTNPEDYFIRLNLTGAEIDNFTIWNDTAPTSTQFTLGLATDINGSNDKYIAYLFASLAGVSKVGSYTGNGTNQTINCGFSAGARFILIKRTDSTGDWYVWDTERGIVAGNDPHFSLNSTAAQVTTDDSIDPDNSGFIVNQVSATNINVSSATYIFYAIA